MAHVPTSDRTVLETRVAALAKQGIKIAPPGQKRPAQMTTTSSSFVRDPAVQRWVLDLAKGKCEGCDFPAPFFTEKGEPYLEVHHVMPLASLGSDRISNAVALCPNCHRRCHHSVDREEFKAGLYQKLARLVPDVSDDTDEGTQVFI
jgi:5-methylcytosine-specific restriction enzyme A